MFNTKRVYLCIDLKSFFASVECAERHLDAMTTNLVVADPDRSKNTICLAITPAMKALGIKNRCRLGQIPSNVNFIIAPPRMQLYINYSAKIYGIYLRYIAKEDMHVYSIDEVFIDVTSYLDIYKKNGKQIAVMLMDEVYKETGIRATCGIGTNLYLAKIALDITAKHSPDFIGILDEAAYCRTLWDHKPLTDFWRIGPGMANRLLTYGINTMRDIAGCREDLLYSIFGRDAELLIDHSKGIEPTTIADIKAYKTHTSSLSSGQVLMKDYTYQQAAVIVREMTDMICLDLVDKELVTQSITLYIGYSGKVDSKPATGTVNLGFSSNSDQYIIPKVIELYYRIIDKTKPIRRINIICNNIHIDYYYYTNLFDECDQKMYRNRQLQKTVNHVKKKYGKNSILKGIDYDENATARERNMQIGGHKSGTTT